MVNACKHSKFEKIHILFIYKLSEPILEIKDGYWWVSLINKIYRIYMLLENTTNKVFNMLRCCNWILDGNEARFDFKLKMEGFRHLLGSSAQTEIISVLQKRFNRMYSSMKRVKSFQSLMENSSCTSIIQVWILQTMLIYYTTSQNTGTQSQKPTSPNIVLNHHKCAKKVIWLMIAQNLRNITCSYVLNLAQNLQQIKSRNVSCVNNHKQHIVHQHHNTMIIK